MIAQDIHGEHYNWHMVPGATREHTDITLRYMLYELEMIRQLVNEHADIAEVVEKRIKYLQKQRDQK